MIGDGYEKHGRSAGRGIPWITISAMDITDERKAGSPCNGP